MAKDLLPWSIAILTSLVATGTCQSQCDDLVFAGSTQVKNVPNLLLDLSSYRQSICHLQNQDNNITFTLIDEIEHNETLRYYWSKLAYDSNDHSILYTRNSSTVYKKSLVNPKSEREIVYSLEFENNKNSDEVIGDVDYDSVTHGTYITTSKWGPPHYSTLRRVMSNRKTSEVSHSDSFYANIQIDSKLGYLFLVREIPVPSSKPKKRVITRMNLEGKNSIDIVTVDASTGLIYSMVVDKNNGKLYWVMTKPNKRNAIMHSNLDGSNVETLKAFKKELDITSIVVDKNYIYTLDYFGTIERFDKTSGLIDPDFKIISNGDAGLYNGAIFILENPPEAISKQAVLSV